MRDCDACQAALKRGPHARLFLLPAMLGLAMAVIKSHGSSLGVRYDTPYT